MRFSDQTNKAINELAIYRYLNSQLFKNLTIVAWRLDVLLGTDKEGAGFRYKVASVVGYLFAFVAWLPARLYLFSQALVLGFEVGRIGEEWWMEANRRELEAANKLTSQ